MNSKILLAGVVLIAICAFVLLSQSPPPAPGPGTDQGSCGDGTCDDFEQLNNVCPEDCSGGTGEVPLPLAPQPPTAQDECISQCVQSGKQPPQCLQECQGSQPVQNVSNLTLANGFALGFMGLEPEESELFAELGAKWVRKNHWYAPDGSFIVPGMPVKPLVEKGTNVLINVEPLALQMPNDYAQYKSRLSGLVSKEKTNVKYWQIGNEPDLIWTMAGKTSDDYVDFFLETAPVIRQVCPECRIVLGGISNQYDSGDNYEYFKTILTEIRAQSTDSRPFDAFDMHLYLFNDSDYTKAQKAAQNYKQLLSETGYDYPIELISTEFGTHSGQPKGTGDFVIIGIPFQSEEAQAKMLIKMHVGFFSNGVTKAFWVSLLNFYKFGHNNPEEGGFWDLVGLAYNGKGSYDLANNLAPGAKKESFYAYKILAAKVRGKTDAEAISENVYKFSGGGETVYVAWSDTTGSLPASISGMVKVTSYMGAEEVKDARSVILTDSPIFIEII